MEMEFNRVPAPEVRFEGKDVLRRRAGGYYFVAWGGSVAAVVALILGGVWYFDNSGRVVEQPQTTITAEVERVQEEVKVEIVEQSVEQKTTPQTQQYNPNETPSSPQPTKIKQKTTIVRKTVEKIEVVPKLAQVNTVVVKPTLKPRKQTPHTPKINGKIKINLFNFPKEELKYNYHKYIENQLTTKEFFDGYFANFTF